ncbi:MAG TPA: Fic family protein [Rhizomicrobium sp.]
MPSALSEKPSKRAGRYVSQPAGYKAFIPEPLPPQPGTQIDAEMQELLSNADRALGRLDGSIQTLPNPDLFVFMYVRKEAVLSSQIEGTQASLSDVIKAEAGILDPSRPSDVSEVINYTAAMNHGLQRLRELPLSRRLIEEIHERLLRNVRGNRMKPGELRKSQNWIGPQGCLVSEALFVPPPHDVAEQALGELEKFLHDESPIPPLIRIGLAHAQFETIHPFLDGNGRVGRLLITFFLCDQKILQRPVLYLSLYLKQHRDKYYACLQNIRDKGEWEEWLKFFLRGVFEVANQATETAKRIVSLREDHRRLIVDHFGNHAGKGMRLLERLYERLTISVNDVAALLGISFPNANALVGKFLRNNLLVEITGQSRNRVFFYRPYMNLFSSI